MPAQPKSSDKPAVKREGPTPVHVLLASIRRAVAANVPADQLLPMLDLACNAQGAAQAPIFRTVATAFDGFAKVAQPAKPAESA